jgi:hypothetical protein
VYKNNISSEKKCTLLSAQEQLHKTKEIIKSIAIRERNFSFVNWTNEFNKKLIYRESFPEKVSWNYSFVGSLFFAVPPFFICYVCCLAFMNLKWVHLAVEKNLYPTRLFWVPTNHGKIQWKFGFQAGLGPISTKFVENTVGFRGGQVLLYKEIFNFCSNR